MLLTPESGGSPQNQTLAEAAVAALIGAITLEQHQVSTSSFLSSSRFVQIEDGPVTGVVSLVVNGGVVQILRAGSWVIELLSAQSGPYAMAYTAGWTVNNLPPNLEAAIRLTARALESRPDPNLTGESMGPVSRSWGPGGSALVPLPAQALLEPWVRLRI